VVFGNYEDIFVAGAGIFDGVHDFFDQIYAKTTDISFIYGFLDIRVGVFKGIIRSA
jgi:hypothetical protein